MEKNIYSIVVKPVMTERGMFLRDTLNQYCFMVRLDATKKEIHRAVEEIFKVSVDKVRTMIVPGKVRRLGRFEGRRSSWKKAIVTLPKGQKIDVGGGGT